MKQVVLLILITALAGCGGYHKAKKGRSARKAPKPVYTAPVSTATPTATAAPTRSRPFANGPLNQACMSSDRKARSRSLCGCIQAVADKTLSGSQQRLAVSFYNDPHKAQEIRQSDRVAHEEFWQDYKNYGETAKRVCG